MTIQKLKNQLEQGKRLFRDKLGVILCVKAVGLTVIRYSFYNRNLARQEQYLLNFDSFVSLINK